MKVAPIKRGFVHSDDMFIKAIILPQTR